MQQHLVLSGADPAVESAAQALLTALEPAIERLASELAEEAATEIEAQLSDYRVEVVLSEGEPQLRVRPIEQEEVSLGDYEARLTLRLPDDIKSLVEEAAGSAGDSVNTWVVKTLSSKAKPVKKRGNRVSGTFEI